MRVKLKCKSFYTFARSSFDFTNFSMIDEDENYVRISLDNEK